MRSWGSNELTPTGIKLSLKLLQLNGEDFVARTPGHEAAHIVDYVVFGNAGHGATWQRVMRLFGQPVERCHNFEVPRSPRKPHDAHCNCTTHHVSTVMFNRIKAGGMYTCRKCKADLKPGTKPEEKPVVKLAGFDKPKKAAPKKPASAGKKGSFADTVRDIIKLNPSADVERIVALIVEQTGANTSKAKRYAKALV